MIADRLRSLINELENLPMPIAIKAGMQTSEGRIVVTLLSLFQLGTAIFIVLITNRAIAVSDAWASALPAIDVLVSGWVANNYVDNRTTLKAAQMAAGTPLPAVASTTVITSPPPPAPAPHP